MNKDELVSLRKKILSFGGAGIIALTSLSGCSRPIPEQTVSQSIQDESLDLAHDNSKLLITVKGIDNKKRIHLTERKSICDLQIYSDSKNYDRYFVSDNATASNTYVYIDIFTFEVVAVKYVNDKEITFLSNEIIKEESAFDYAKEYIGVKQTYNMNELDEMMNNLREDSIEKQYSK